MNRIAMKTWIFAAALLCASQGARAQFAHVECCDDTPGAATACVWLNRGSAGGLSAGGAVPLFNGDLLAGLFEPELIVEGSSTGTITRAADYSGPLCTLKDGANADATHFRYEIFELYPVPADSVPDIIVPDGSEKIALSAEWDAAWDAALHTSMLDFAAQPPRARTPFPLLPGSDSSPSLAIVSSAVAARPVIPEDDEVVAVHLDPAIADALKSSYYVESGDCLHIAPWPGAAQGMVVHIDDTLAIPYPGAAINARGKTVSRIERELTNILRAADARARAVITPCRDRDTIF